MGLVNACVRKTTSVLTKVVKPLRHVKKVIKRNPHKAIPAAAAGALALSIVSWTYTIRESPEDTPGVILWKGFGNSSGNVVVEDGTSVQRVNGKKDNVSLGKQTICYRFIGIDS